MKKALILLFLVISCITRICAAAVPAVDGNFDSAIDIRKYGALADGRDDAGSAINACLAENSVCLVPAVARGFFVKTPVKIPPGKWLIGVVSDAENASPDFRFSGVSLIQCSATMEGACVTWGVANNLSSGGVRNITISRQSGLPRPGQKGLVFAGGYNVRIEGVSVSNFDTCYEFDQGISGQGVNNYAQSCSTHYWVFNTWPEFSQTGGRSGANGRGNYNTAKDNIYFTSSQGHGGGGTGPNSIDFINYKFDNDKTPCAFRWGNYTIPPGSSEAFNFVNIYKEPLPAGASVFCSDKTVSHITGVRLQNSYISQDIGPADLFKGLSPATQLKSWMLTNNLVYLSGATLSPIETGGDGLYNVVFLGNYLPSATFTPGGGPARGDKLTLIGNFYNGILTINQGTHGWQQLTIIGDEASKFVNNSDRYGQNISMAGIGSVGDVRTVDGLPQCNSNDLGSQLVISDGNNPRYLQPIIGGGHIVSPVFCDGNRWVAH